MNEAKKKKRKRIRNKGYSGKGWIADSIYGPEVLYDYFWELTENIDFDAAPAKVDDYRQKTHRFICHVYNSSKNLLSKKDIDIEYNKDGLIYVPVFGRLIDQEFGKKFSVYFLREKGLIKIIGADKLRGKARHFSLPMNIYQTARDIENEYIRKAWEALVKGENLNYKYCDIITRKKKSPRKNKFSKNKREIEATPEVRKSMQAIGGCVFNPRNVHVWVNGLEKAYKAKEKTYHELLNTEASDARKEIALYKLRSFERKLMNERMSQQTILFQNPTLCEFKSKGNNPLYRYRAAYMPQRSGRLSEIGGGLQNASRVFKYRAFVGVESYNYDLKASQATILIQELEQAGFDATWLKKYIKMDSGKEHYAKKVGVDTETWKQCLYSTIMGSDPYLPYTTIEKVLLKYFKYTKHLSGSEARREAKKAKNRFSCQTKSLTRESKKWREYLISKDSPYIYTAGQYKYWRNACGMKHRVYCYDRNDKLYLTENVKNHEKTKGKEPLKDLSENSRHINSLKRKIAAFILQGLEARFIHNLTVLCESHDVVVMRNEHDGLITDKKISEDLVKKARDLSGFKDADIEIKKLASKNELTDAKSIIKVNK